MNPESAPLPSQQPTLPSAPVPQPGESSSKKPIVIIFIIILLLGIGAFYYFMVRQESNSSKVSSVNEAQKIPQPVVTAIPTPTVNLDSSDTQLDRDIQSINNKANNLASDVLNVDQSLNDKPLDSGQ